MAHPAFLVGRILADLSRIVPTLEFVIGRGARRLSVPRQPRRLPS
jgi:hypothetical protein